MLAVSTELREACLAGKMDDMLSKSIQRLHLTLRCECCGRKYDRAADLACHLQVSHARLWRTSKGLVQALIATVYQNRGCCCNPQLGQKRASHVCLPLRQIAMAFFRLGQEPFIPFPVKEHALSQLMAPNLVSTLRFKLEQVLSSGQWDQLWQDADLRCTLSTTCLQCGALHAPPELGVHLRELHICQHASIHFYMTQLMTVFLKCCPEDYRCVHCQQIFNLPPQLVSDIDTQNRQTLAQSHLLCHCPCLLQVSVLLASILNGRRIGFVGPGFPTGDLGHLSGAPNPVGQLTEAITRPSESKATQGKRPLKRRRRGVEGSQRAGTEPDATPCSPPSTQTRAGDLRVAPIRHIHAVLQQGAAHRNITDSGGRNSELESSAGGQDLGHHAAAAASDEGSADRPAQQGVTKISKSAPTEEVILLMKQKGLLTEELSWPFLEWDTKAKALRQTSKTPVSMAKMQHVEELVEMVRDPTVIVRFDALNPKSTQEVIVWRLQICLRRDDLWDLLMQLTHSSMWALIGTTFKVHSQRPSQLAQSLQTMLQSPQKKGGGKGKHGHPRTKV